MISTIAAAATIPTASRRLRTRGSLWARAPRRRPTNKLGLMSEPVTAQGLRIEVDRELCFGFGDCVDTAPKVFALDEHERRGRDPTPTARAAI